MSVLPGLVAAGVFLGMTMAGALATDDGGMTMSPDRIEMKQGAAAPDPDAGTAAKDGKKPKSKLKRLDKSTPMLSDGNHDDSDTMMDPSTNR